MIIFVVHDLLVEEFSRTAGGSDCQQIDVINKNINQQHRPLSQHLTLSLSLTRSLSLSLTGSHSLYKSDQVKNTSSTKDDRARVRSNAGTGHNGLRRACHSVYFTSPHRPSPNTKKHFFYSF